MPHAGKIEGKHMTGKRKAAGVGILCAVLTVTGCQHTTETVIVTPKNAMTDEYGWGSGTIGGQLLY